MAIKGSNSARGVTHSEGSLFSDYLALLKPRVMFLVVFTGFAGMVAAPGAVHPFRAAAIVLLIALGAGAAAAINMWYDRDIDALMERTSRRPIPAGRVVPAKALALGIALGLLSVVSMGAVANQTAAMLLALAIGFYVFVYTIWLKRRTPQNIVVGGAAGALPPAIGWSAVTGQVGLESIALFLIIFMWTPPHFWALALCRSDDYARAEVPMLPVVAGTAETKRQIMAYSAILVLLSFTPLILGMAGLVYGGSVAVMGAYFLLLAVRVLNEEGCREARRLFRFSIFYLFVLFAALIVDRAVAKVAMPVVG